MSRRLGLLVPLLLAVWVPLSPPAGAAHQDATYTGTVEGGGTVLLRVLGDMVTSLDAMNVPCDGGASQGSGNLANLAISGDPHGFGNKDADLWAHGTFQPGTVEGGLKVLGGCHAEAGPFLHWTAAPAGQPQVGVAGATAKEGKRPWCAFEITVAGSAPVEVPLATRDGQGKAGKDYEPIDTTSILPPGGSVVRIPTIDDGKVEEREVFRLAVGDAEGSCRIESDDDPRPKPPDRCRCGEKRVLKPKGLQPEAWYLDGGSPETHFLIVRIPLRIRLRCSPGAGKQCTGRIAHDEDFFEATWLEAGSPLDVKDLHVLPRILACSGPCNGLAKEREQWWQYTGWRVPPESDLTYSWPVTGSLRFRFVVICDTIRHKVRVNAEVTLPGPPLTSPGASAGTTVVTYKL